jgi:hypothetical protein
MSDTLYDEMSALQDELATAQDRLRAANQPRVDLLGHGPWQLAIVETKLIVRMCSRCGQMEDVIRAVARRGPDGMTPREWCLRLRGDGSCTVGRGRARKVGGGR